MLDQRLQPKGGDAGTGLQLEVAAPSESASHGHV